MSAPRKNPLTKIIDGSFVLGAASTLVFYLIVHSPGMRDSVVHRYTTQHYVEYVVVALSFWGLVDILRKLAGFPLEAYALRRSWLPARTNREPVSRAAEYLQFIREQPGWVQQSGVGRRFDDALKHLVETGSAADFQEHLRNLADYSAERTNGRYSLVRFVIRVTPVLGFLGTVVHFGTALNGMSFDKMADHLTVIVSEMGQAFNTTTAALASAMVMMFAQFVCEWIELSLVHTTDRTVERELLNRFEVKDANILPFLSAMKSANEEALLVVAGHVSSQTEVWSKALESLFERFEQRQRRESAAWTEAVDVLAARHESYDALREERLRQMLDLVDDRQSRMLEYLQQSIERAATLRDGFGDFVATLNRIAAGEGKLAELQSTLADNLSTLQQARQLDEAVHGLTSAIHLMMSRQQPSPRAAA